MQASTSTTQLLQRCQPTPGTMLSLDYYGRRANDSLASSITYFDDHKEEDDDGVDDCEEDEEDGDDDNALTMQ